MQHNFESLVLESFLDHIPQYLKLSQLESRAEHTGFTISNQHETITSLIESLKNGPENYVLTDEGDISDYIGVNINKNSYETFNLSQSHLVGK